MVLCEIATTMRPSDLEQCHGLGTDISMTHLIVA
jgi:hypothetical protein